MIDRPEQKLSPIPMHQKNFYCMARRNFLFFFQAEDGIRDYKVTGVQTCALPISYAPTATARPSVLWIPRLTSSGSSSPPCACMPSKPMALSTCGSPNRYANTSDNTDRKSVV